MAYWSYSYGGKSDSELRIAYGTQSHSPQYAVLHLNDSYLRLTNGPECGWGTSVVTMPVYWSGGKNHQGVKIHVEAAVQGDNLVVQSNGMSNTLQNSTTIEFYPPLDGLIAARVKTRTIGTLALDDRIGEAFKPVFLSSMHISDLNWDCSSAFIADDTVQLPKSGFIVPPSMERCVKTFGLNGGTSRWKKNAPTVTIELEQPMAVAGWVAGSKNPNGDNVGLWAASNEVLPFWSYTIRTSS